MARRAEIDPLDRLFERLDEAQPGVHDIDPPVDDLPVGLPAPLIELYARCDGARIFSDTLEIVPSSEVTYDGARWRFGAIDGEPIGVDHKGKVWRTDASVEDEVVDGTRIDRWLAGQLDALALLFDHEGEYQDDVFDEDGELLPVVREKQLRAQLKRDAAAPGPRWRLAHTLLEQGAAEDARNELEQVVADDPVFAWAWLDLARVSERLGEVGGALDEARMAADAAEGVQHPQAGYFWSQVAGSPPATATTSHAPRPRPRPRCSRPISSAPRSTAPASASTPATSAPQRAWWSCCARSGPATSKCSSSLVASTATSRANRATTTTKRI